MSNPTRANIGNRLTIGNGMPNLEAITQPRRTQAEVMVKKLKAQRMRTQDRVMALKIELETPKEESQT